MVLYGWGSLEAGKGPLFPNKSLSNGVRAGAAGPRLEHTDTVEECRTQIKEIRDSPDPSGCSLAE